MFVLFKKPHIYADVLQVTSRCAICGIYGHSFFATIRKSDGSFIGHCGLLRQEIEGEQEIELAYVLAKEYWQQGLAFEGILALKNFGFQQFGFSRIVSLIPPGNHASMHFAEKIGTHYDRDVDQWGQHFRLFVVQQPRTQAETIPLGTK